MFRLTELFGRKKLIYGFGLLILAYLVLQFHTWLCFLLSQNIVIEINSEQLVGDFTAFIVLKFETQVLGQYFTMISCF